MSKNTHPFWDIVTTTPNFPKQGIDFYDITPLLNGHIDALADGLLACLPKDVFDKADYLCGIESRGFILASILATKTGKPLILVRKKGKLPPPVYSYSYDLEYGSDTLEISANVKAGKVLIVDDVLATGGTLSATIELCTQAGHDVLGALLLLNLVELHGKMATPVYHVLQA